MFVGVDGCPAGWYAVRAAHAGSHISGTVHAHFADVLAAAGPEAHVAVDIPIGLRAAGSRTCDELARRALAPTRGSSVFPAPLRSVLDAASHQDASDIRRRIDGKGMSIQAYAITRKVHEVDIALRAAGERATRVYEVHPELCFARLNDGPPMTFAKRTSQGREERLARLAAVFGDAPARLVEGRARSQVNADDVLDAFAALWTAMRIGRGAHDSLPAEPERDAHGLRMAIFV